MLFKWFKKKEIIDKQNLHKIYCIYCYQELKKEASICICCGTEDTIKNRILSWIVKETPPIIIVAPAVIIGSIFGYFWGILTGLFSLFLFFYWLFKSYEKEEQEKFNSIFRDI